MGYVAGVGEFENEGQKPRGSGKGPQKILKNNIFENFEKKNVLEKLTC